MVAFVSITPENKENKDNRLVNDIYVTDIVSAAHVIYNMKWLHKKKTRLNNYDFLNTIEHMVSSLRRLYIQLIARLSDRFHYIRS